MEPNYWDLNNFLLLEEEITCEVISDKLNSMGLLDQDKAENHILEKNSTIRIPIWCGIALQNKDAVKIKEPSYLSSKFYAQLSTDPVIINLKVKSEFYYDVVALLIPNLFEVIYEWSNIIWKSLVERYLNLYYKSKNVVYENYGLLKTLTSNEKEFYMHMVNLHNRSKEYLQDFKKLK